MAENDSSVKFLDSLTIIATTSTTTDITNISATTNIITTTTSAITAIDTAATTPYRAISESTTNRNVLYLIKLLHCCLINSQLCIMKTLVL